ncbi:hypothetical protein BGZ65_002990 [Modicella reniformis]|uniref:Uncharacterized protein n=1 Tax=Modicella reniformis TaxID=1440133 RepID=A0A9P6SMB4_9FUNG|nr:hypothetical protein BGZ65_002990 [Modicella reniformis]
MKTGSSVLRLLPIQSKPKYYDQADDSEDSEDETYSEEEKEPEDGEEGSDSDSDSDSNEKDDDSEYDMTETSGIGAHNDVQPLQEPNKKMQTLRGTKPTTEEFYEVRTDIDKRIQRAARQVEQQLVDRDETFGERTAAFQQKLMLE